jgi:hypothetical protein
MLGAKLDQGFILIGGVALAGHAVFLSGGSVTILSEDEPPSS